MLLLGSQLVGQSGKLFASAASIHANAGHLLAQALESEFIDSFFISERRQTLKQKFKVYI